MSAAFETASVTRAIRTAIVAIPGIRTTPSSTSVSTPSTTKIATYWARCVAPRAVESIAALERSDKATSRHEVDEGEDEDPHEIDEAPVEAEEVLQEHGRDVEDARQDVEAVESGDDVEGAGAWRPPEDEPFADEAGPLPRLAEQEQQPAERGDGEQHGGSAAAPLDRGCPGEHVREARADEEEGERGRERDSQRWLAWLHPLRASPAEDALGDEQAAEGERVRDEEDPHPDLPRSGGPVLGVRGPCGGAMRMRGRDRHLRAICQLRGCLARRPRWGRALTVRRCPSTTKAMTLADLSGRAAARADRAARTAAGRPLFWKIGR